MIDAKSILEQGNAVAQGEVYLWMEKHAPKGVLAMRDSNIAEPLELENGKLIIGHSETGHHHVLETIDRPSVHAEVLIRDAEGLIADMELEYETQLRHLRDHDTHEAYLLPPGRYIRLLRQEQTQIKGWQRSID